MRLQLLNSSFGPGPPCHFATTYLIDQSIAVDAGSLGFMAPVERQRPVRHVFLSHSHIDHIASLPLFLETVHDDGPDCPTVYGNAHVLEALRRDVFNDRLWPDFVNSESPSPFVRLIPIDDGDSIEIDGVVITAVAVDHAVPTLGFLVQDKGATVVLSGDTGPTERLWELARQAENLRAVFLEAAFPDSMQWLADVAGHLTPATFAGELAKLHHPARVIVVHVKPRFQEQTLADLASLGVPLEIASPGAEYTFDAPPVDD